MINKGKFYEFAFDCYKCLQHIICFELDTNKKMLKTYCCKFPKKIVTLRPFSE
jgi:hypothetical protein